MAEPLPVQARRRYRRFATLDRAEHILLLAIFSTLAITGLVQKFAEAGISQAIIAALGGIESTRVVHHVAAVVLMLEAVFHLGSMGYKVFVRHARLEMMPGLTDARRAWRAFRFNVGLAKDRPQEGRYTFAEKAEYWAVVWGTVIMAVTGFMMWNPISTTRLLPGQVVPAAKAAHGYEAILAVLAILVWHLYHVHLRHFNKSMFTGYLDEQVMLEDHPLELADLKAGVAQRPADPKAVARRRRIFLPVYAVIALLLLAGVYAFVSYEQTAITTLPEPVDVPVFVPLTPTAFPTRPPTATKAPSPTMAPSPTPVAGATEAPTAIASTWLQEIGPALASACGTCHTGDGGMAGLDLSTYAGAMRGGNSGPAIVPGDPAASVLVQRQQAGNHPGQLGSAELDLIIAWILSGAPE